MKTVFYEFNKFIFILMNKWFIASKLTLNPDKTDFITSVTTITKLLMIGICATMMMMAMG
jgi:hypothetical protein